MQLQDVFCARSRSERRDKADDNPAEYSLEVDLASTDLSDDRLEFQSRVTARVTTPVLDDEFAALEVVVQGNYAASEPIEPELHKRFVEYTPLVQLWPYARAYMAILAQMLSIALPTLPLLSGLEPAEGEDEEPPAPDSSPS